MGETEVQESVATDYAKPWETRFGFELTTKRPESDRTYTYLGNIEPSYQFASAWRIALFTEAELVQDPAGKASHWNDTRITISNGGVALGDSVRLEAKAMGLFPTKRSERDAGLQVSPGMAAVAEFSPTGKWKLTYDIEGYRLLRDKAKAGYRADFEQPPAAEGFDRIRLAQKAGIAYQLVRNVWLSGSATHTWNWKWFGGRETLQGFQQSLTYDWDTWSFGLGHRSETTVRGAGGETRSLAFARPEE
jgi:hypothetical protein